MNFKEMAKVVENLANVASTGDYTIKPNEARLMNTVFAQAAQVINKLLELSEREMPEVPEIHGTDVALKEEENE